MAKQGVRRRKGGKQDETLNETNTNNVSKPAVRFEKAEEKTTNIPVNISDLVMMVSLVFGGCCL